MEQMTTSKGSWYGRPLEKHSKEELIDIIVCLAEASRRTLEQNIKARKTLAAFGRN